jgi:hypothetical protein
MLDWLLSLPPSTIHREAPFLLLSVSAILFQKAGTSFLASPFPESLNSPDLAAIQQAATTTSFFFDLFLFVAFLHLLGMHRQSGASNLIDLYMD